MAGFSTSTHVSFIFFFSIALFLIVFPASSSTGLITVHDAQLIETACSYASGYKALCISALSERGESFTANITGLMSIACDIAFTNGSIHYLRLIDYAKEATDPVVRGVMLDCRNHYDNSTLAILDAKWAAEAKNMEEALRRISVAITEAQLCGEALKRLQGRSAPFDASKYEKDLALINIANVMIYLALK